VSQQLAIIVMIDTENALEAGTLRGNTYLVDNMRRLGSRGECSGDLVSAVVGGHWSNGGQAQEQILNWLVGSLGSVPLTLPRNYHSHRVHRHDSRSLQSLGRLADAGGANAEDGDPLTEVRRIHREFGARIGTARGRHRHAHCDRLMDLTGRIVPEESSRRGDPVHSHPAPVLVDLCGEAVEKKVIHPAQYGSPDQDTDGWYWSAAVDTSRPGTYSYTMVVELQQLVRGPAGRTWRPRRMSHKARLNVTSTPMRNGFTGAGIGYLPVPSP